MSKNLYLGNLDYSVTETLIGDLFSQYGDIKNINILDDRGIGFVEMVNEADGIKAMEELNDTDFMGRKLIVKEARLRKQYDKNRNRNYKRGSKRGGQRY